MKLDPNKIEDEQVDAIFQLFPEQLYDELFFLRKLIIQTAIDSNEVNELTETLKWNEPSYLTKMGSTIRLGWNKSSPQQYMIYFHCKTKLVDTFKELYGDTFRYEGNRAIVFNKADLIPEKALSHCILLSLTYKNIKHLPLLGAQPLSA